MHPRLFFTWIKGRHQFRLGILPHIVLLEQHHSKSVLNTDHFPQYVQNCILQILLFFCRSKRHLMLMDNVFTLKSQLLITTEVGMFIFWSSNNHCLISGKWWQFGSSTLSLWWDLIPYLQECNILPTLGSMSTVNFPVLNDWWTCELKNQVPAIRLIIRASVRVAGIGISLFLGTWMWDDVKLWLLYPFCYYTGPENQANMWKRT